VLNTVSVDCEVAYTVVRLVGGKSLAETESMTDGVVLLVYRTT